MKLNALKRKFKNFDGIIKSFTSGKWDYIAGGMDLLYCRLRYKVPVDEYLKYKFYNYQHRYRKNFILERNRDSYAYLNTGAFTRSKYTFYKYIPEFFAREMILAPFCGEAAFVEFLRKHQKIVAKPDQGSLGKGLEVVLYTDDEAAKTYFAGITAERPFICEEFIKQHSVLGALNPTTVNTIRITSLMVDGEVEIISATLKAGTGTDNIVDNLSRGGIGAQIDVESGIVCTFGKDFELKRYTHHPTSGTPILGLQIPHWQTAIETIKEAHKRIPQCMLYGWDIAITETGVDIVEANCRPGSRIMQVMDGVPKGEKILPLLKKDHLKDKREEYTSEFRKNYKKHALGQ